jgi:RsiW-degrading membrane proteinase PrsW (M82 family)
MSSRPCTVRGVPEYTKPLFELPRPWLISLTGSILGVLVIASVFGNGVLAPLTIAASLVPAVLGGALALIVGRYLRLPVRVVVYWCVAGMTVAAPLAALASLGIAGSSLSTLAFAVVVAPVTEELVKLVVARSVAPDRSRVVMLAAACCVAGGFAATEDALYLTAALADGTYVSTMIARCLLSPLVHIAFSAVVVLGVHRGRLVQIACVLAGILLHASWNLSTSSPNNTLVLFVVMAITFAAVPIVVVGVSVAWQRSVIQASTELARFSNRAQRVAAAFFDHRHLHGLSRSAVADARCWSQHTIHKVLWPVADSSWSTLRDEAANWQWSAPAGRAR